MALRGALVDTARMVAQEETTVKVEGTTQFQTVTHPWFRCRVWQQTLPRRTDVQNGGTVADRQPQMMYDIRDEDGDPVVLTIRDKVEVRSKEQAIDTLIFELDGDPAPIRKKRKVIGYEVTVKKIEAHHDPRLP
jgi:hypothetical protein